MTLCQNPGQSASAHTIYTIYTDIVISTWSNIKITMQKSTKIFPTFMWLNINLEKKHELLKVKFRTDLLKKIHI